MDYSYMGLPQLEKAVLSGDKEAMPHLKACFLHIELASLQIGAKSKWPPLGRYIARISYVGVTESRLTGATYGVIEAIVEEVIKKEEKTPIFKHDNITFIFSSVVLGCANRLFQFFKVAGVEISDPKSLNCDQYIKEANFGALKGKILEISGEEATTKQGYKIVNSSVVRLVHA